MCSVYDSIRAVAPRLRSSELIAMARSSLPALLVLGLCGLAFVGPMSRTRRGVQMRGFKDDFYAWKDTLSSEDQVGRLLNSP